MSDLLAINGLDAAYGSAHVLFDVSLVVPEGAIVALLGRNGAGKSTTLKSIMRLDVRTKGAMRFDGHDLSRLSTAAIARLGVGYVPEDRRIFQAMTARENLLLGRRIGGLGRPPLELDAVLAAFPHLESLLERRGGVLSGGEQQLLAIARSLIGNPRLMLLDEPSEGLAPRVLIELRDAIRMVHDQFGVTVLLTEQNATFAMALAGDVVVIETGRIVHRATTSELRAQPEVLQGFLGVGRKRAAERAGDDAHVAAVRPTPAGGVSPVDGTTPAARASGPGGA